MSFRTISTNSDLSLEYNFVNYLHGTTAQSEMFQKKRLSSKPAEVIACFIVSFVLNTWIFHTSDFLAVSSWKWSCIVV